MSKIGKCPVSMRNYWIERSIQDENATYDDHTEFVWQYDQRMKIVEPLIRDTACFAADVSKLCQRPSLMSEGAAVRECIEGVYDVGKARSWIFSYLYQQETCQANAVYILFSSSHISQGFQLWRTLFETYVICDFLRIRASNSVLLLDYISHTLLRSWIRMKEGVNSLCQNDGVELKYEKSQIDSCKDLYKSKNWKLNEDYAWAKSILNKDRCKFHDILNEVDSDLSIFYRISSMEVHPTLGDRFALLSLGTLPLPAVPVSSYGIVEQEDLQLDSLTTKILHRMTCMAKTFLQLNAELDEQLETLKIRGMDVLEKRRGAASPIVQGSRHSVVHHGG